MKVVLDANIVVSAAITAKGPSAQIMRAWRAHSFTWVTSQPLIEELQRTFASPRLQRYLSWSAKERAEVLALIRGAARIVFPTFETQVTKDDPADRRAVEAAVEGSVDYVVSGESDLLELERHARIEVVTPARFVAIIAAGLT